MSNDAQLFAKWKTSSVTKISNNSMGGGKFFVPENEYEEFLKIYGNALKNGAVCYMTEQVKGCPKKRINFFVDIDFDFSICNPPSHSHWKSILDFICESISEATDVFRDHIEENSPVFSCRMNLISNEIFKFHINFPELVISTDQAKKLGNLIIDHLKMSVFDSDTEFYEKNWVQKSNVNTIIDLSVYDTGLRMLGSSKTIKQKKKDEPDNYSTFYSIVEFDSNNGNWVNKKNNITLKNLKKVSIIPPKNASLLDPDFGEDIILPERKKNKKLTKSVITEESITKSNEITVRNEKSKEIDVIILDYIEDKFRLRKEAKSIKLLDINNIDAGYVIELSLKYCNFVKREHTNNHQYIVIINGKACQKCHSKKECIGKESEPIDIPKSMLELLKRKYADDTLESIDQQLIDSAMNEAKQHVGDHINNEENDEIPMDLVKKENKDVTLNGKINNCNFDQLGHRCKNPHILTFTSQEGLYMCCTNCDWRYPKKDLLGIPERYTTLKQFFIQVNINNTTNNYYGANGDDIILDHDEHLNDSYCAFENDDKLNLVFKKTFTGGHSDIAIFLCEYYQDTIVSSGSNKTLWYHFNGTRWMEDDSKSIIIKIITGEEIRKYYKKAFLHYSSLTTDHSKKLTVKLSKLIENLSKTPEVTNIVKMCATFMYEPYKKLVANLDQQKYLIGFENGVYDLESDIFRPAKKEDYISLSTGYNYEPFDKHSEIANEIMDFIIKILPIDDVRYYVLKHLGSCLTGDTKDELLHIYVGEGANGKSTLVRLIESSLGEYATSMKTTFLTQKNPPADSATPAITKTINRRFVSLQEVNQNENLNEALVKQMTGNDKLDYRKMYREAQEFRPQFKLVMCTNHPVEIKGTDHGIWRRIRMIEFKSTFTENITQDNEGDRIYVADKSVISKIDTLWRPVFMGILIHYFKKWRKHGLKDIPEDIDKFTRKYKSEMNVYDQFLKECCIIDKTNKELKVSRDILEESFFTWYRSGDFSDRKIKPKDFKKEISKRFGSNNPDNDKISIDGNQVRGWNYISLLE